MAKVNKHATFFGLIYLGFFLATKGTFLTTCQTRCDDQPASPDRECNQECRVDACQTGCTLWDNSTLLEGCIQSCNETLSNETFKVQYCERGCAYSADSYANAIFAADPQNAPTLFGLPTSTSIPIEWSGSENPEVFYNVQWQFSDIPGSRWSTYRSTSDTQINVTDLRPFTSYIFRVEWVVFSQDYTAFSNQSVPIRTEAGGPPLDAPRITNLVSQSPTTILVEWREVIFPAGEIVSYELTLDFPSLMKFTALPSARSHRFFDLSPNQVYNVTVAATNSDGTGPLSFETVTTLEEPTDNGTTPYLVVGVDRVSFLNSSIHVSAVELLPIPYDTSIESTTVHVGPSENSRILDVSVHYYESYLFFIDEMQTIHRKNLSNISYAVNEPFTEKILVGSAPVKLDVDWLFDEIYYIEGENIMRCMIDGTDVKLAVGPRGSRPLELTVDPFNGFLFWAEASGIYRLDLQHVKDSDMSMVELVVAVENATAFTTDPSTNEIFFYNVSDNTIGKAQLDGSRVREERSSKDSFGNMTSLQRYNSLFHWTEEFRLRSCLENQNITLQALFWFEEEGSNIKEYNGFVCSPDNGGLDILHPSSQPFPFPVEKPRDLQVLFGVDSALVSWEMVGRSGIEGRGAWDLWTYEVEVADVVQGSVNTGFVDPGITYINMSDLSANTEYRIRVRALSQAGTGPWSDSFTGSTFIETDPEAVLLLSTDEHLVKTELDGTNVEVLITLDAAVMDLSWTQNYALWVSKNRQEIYSLSLVDSSNTPSLVTGHSSTSIGALANDWIGRKLYWSDNGRNEIYRADLDLAESVLSDRETILTFTSVRDLALDSVNGYIYWTEKLRLKAARLNGGNDQTITEYSDFANEEIAGLTLDFDGGKVFWFVLASVDGETKLELFSADLLHISNDGDTFQWRADSNTMQATLHTFSEKLFWVDADKRLVISELDGISLSRVPSDPVSEVTVVQNSTLQPYPDGFSRRPNVIPNDVVADDIVVDDGGVWNDFIVTWSNNSEVEHATVFYGVEIDSTDMSYRYSNGMQEENSVRIQDLDPFTSIIVRVSAFTYWSTSASAMKMLRSPMAAPSAPLNPRLFISEDYDVVTGESVFTAIFRWDRESQTNGILDKYIVRWGNDTNNLVTDEVSNSTFEFTTELFTLDDYFFQVSGRTAAGEGPATEFAQGSLQAAVYPPSFLAPTSDGFSIVDGDTGESVPGPDGASVVTYHTESQTWYYFLESILMKRTGDTSMTLYVSSPMAPTQNSFTLDWISLKLYWAISTSVYVYDTTQETSEDVNPRILSFSGNVEGLVVSPLENLLIWSEEGGDSGSILKWYNLTDLDSQSRRKRQVDGSTCDVPITGAFALDTGASGSPRLFSVEKENMNIWVSDSTGCSRVLLFNSSTESGSALPATSMTVDQTRLYWINQNGKLASVNKVTGDGFRVEDTEADVVIATGRHLQPYPAPVCLIPAGPITAPSLTEAFESSLDLRLDPVSVASGCGSISLATPTYTVYYSEGIDCNDTEERETVETTGLAVTLEDLEPYTDYCYKVMVSNMYTSQEQANNLTSDTAVSRTWVGVPSSPRNVTLEIMTPREILVSWLEPEILNGPPESLVYEVTGGATNLLNIKGNTATLTNLDPKRTYTITVLVEHDNSKSEEKGSSKEEEGTTFENPESPTESSKSHYNITVCWMSSADGSIQKYQLQYRFDGSPVSDDVPDDDFTDQPEVDISNEVTPAHYCSTIGSSESPLRPYSDYTIQLRVWFVSGRLYDDPQSELSIESMTEGDVPGVITDLIVENNQVSWTEPDRRGPGDLMYTLEAMEVSAKRATGEWMLAYEGPQTVWNIDFDEGVMYIYRVAATNDVGMGSFSPESAPYARPIPDAAGVPVGAIVGAVIVVVVIAIIVIILIFCLMKKREEKKNFGGPVSYQTDTELATLRDYPTTMEGNQIYALTTSADGKEAKLPLFPRERLKLLTFLGSGAFGEVFEGVALNILTDTSGKTRVAVKTLKKGASDEEKEDFLKEAILMSNFHHANIMSLLGVCLDNDPQYIILELMEGGDLLTYLRAARATDETARKLSEADLVDIVTDIARGCKYLEELHFVHRDLAARNCLVSCKGYEDAKCRIVKIGDFGLARDIYKSDYYRKEGEGLLPVRWMAPEALIDGLFTNASDIWAFGVLVWEVFTLGQQPYPAMTNIEVLKFVTEGGRLESPEECPDDMYALMHKCWERTAKVRPSFLIILDRCENFRRKSYGPGYDNQAFLDEKVNYSKVNQSLETNDYLEPMDSKDIQLKKKPPDLVVDGMEKEKASAPVGKKREGSFRRLLAGAGLDGGPKSPQPILDAAAERKAWNKPAVDERYLAMPVGRSASSIQPGTKPEVKTTASVARGESVNIPANSTRPELGSKKRRAPTSPLAANGNFGMPERPAPVPPSPSSRGSSEPHSRTSSQSSVNRPSGPPPTRPSSKKVSAPKAPPSSSSHHPQQNGNNVPQSGGRHPNPFRQFSEDGDQAKLKVEYYNV